MKIGYSEASKTLHPATALSAVVALALVIGAGCKPKGAGAGKAEAEDAAPPPQTWTCIGTGDKVTGVCSAGAGCALMQANILCPSKYVDLRGSSEINNWEKTGKWTSLKGKVAVADFKTLEPDEKNAKCKLARRNARVHVCDAPSAATFFGLVRLDRYEQHMLTDDLFVTVVPADVNSDALEAAMDAQRLVLRAQTADATASDKLAVISTVKGATDDVTRRAHAEAFTSAAFDFAALSSQEATLKKQVADDEQKKKDELARMPKFDQLAATALTPDAFYERYWPGKASNRRAYWQKADANDGRNPDDNLWTLFPPGSKACSEDDLPGRHKGNDASEPSEPVWKGGSMNEFQLKERVEKWTQEHDRLVKTRATLADEMKKTVVAFDCPAARTEDCPIALPRFAAASDEAIHYDFAKKGYALTFRALDDSPWPLGDGKPKIGTKAQSMAMSTGKRDTGLFIGGKSVQVQGSENVSWTKSSNLSTMAIFYAVDESTAKEKNYGPSTKVRLRLLLQLQNAGLHTVCRRDNGPAGADPAHALVSNDGLGLVLGTKLRGYQVYFDKDMVAEKLVE